MGCDRMRYMRETLRDEYMRYAAQYPDMSSLQKPYINISDTLRAYFILADYFTDPTADQKSERMLVGVRDMNLLVSALGRQNVSFAGTVKYSSPLDICATLFLGLVKNHAFLDGNKRTALLTLLYQLDNYGYCPAVPQREFEQLVVATAANQLETKYDKQWKGVPKQYRAVKTDHSVQVISKLLNKMVRKKDNSFHLDITARALIEAINKVPGCSAVVEGRKIKLQRKMAEKRIWIWVQQEAKEYSYAIPYKGDTRTVGAETARKVLDRLHLYDQYPSYSSFIEGEDPRYMLIQQFEGPLRRLKDK